MEESLPCCNRCKDSNPRSFIGRKNDGSLFALCDACRGKKRGTKRKELETKAPIQPVDTVLSLKKGNMPNSAVQMETNVRYTFESEEDWHVHKHTLGMSFRVRG